MVEANPERKSSCHIQCITSAFHQFLTATGLHENMRLYHITKTKGLQWIEYMQTPRVFPRRRVPKAVTINSKVKQVRHFLQHCVRKDWLQANPFADIGLSSTAVGKSRQRKEPFTEKELAIIFAALPRFAAKVGYQFRHTAPLRREFVYAILLLAFTGARAMEVVQLDVADVRKEDGIWMVDLTTTGEDGKSLKNVPSRRKIPIHPQLLPYFLPWFETRQEHKKLFHLLVADDYGATRAARVSSWFTVILKSAKIKRPAVSLHSLRHTMTHKLTHARTDSKLQNRLLGHQIGRDVEATSYQHSLDFPLQEKLEALQKVSYPTISVTVPVEEE